MLLLILAACVTPCDTGSVVDTGEDSAVIEPDLPNDTFPVKDPIVACTPQSTDWATDAEGSGRRLRVDSNPLGECLCELRSGGGTFAEIIYGDQGIVTVLAAGPFWDVVGAAPALTLMDDAVDITADVAAFVTLQSYVGPGARRTLYFTSSPEGLSEASMGCD